MSDLFCMYCDPPASGQHQKTCRLYKEPDDTVLDKFEDVMQQASELFDQDFYSPEAKEKIRNARKRKMESTGEA